MHRKYSISDLLNIAHQNSKNGFKNIFSLKDFKPDLEYFLIDLIIMQEEIRMKKGEILTYF